VSNVTRKQFTEAQKISPIVCVQNFYNVANRHDDAFIDELAKPIYRTFHFSRSEDSLHYSLPYSTR
jgi:hypothetical protein